MRHDFACRLVVSNHPWWRWVDPNPYGFAIDLYGIPKLDSLPDVGWLGIHRNTPFQYQLLHFQAGAQSSLSKYLVKFWAFGLRRQNAFGHLKCHVRLVGIKLTGNDLLKTNGSKRRLRLRQSCRHSRSRRCVKCDAPIRRHLVHRQCLCLTRRCVGGYGQILVFVWRHGFTFMRLNH